MAGADGMPESLVTTGIDLTDREAREDDDALEGDPGAKLAQVSRLAMTETKRLFYEVADLGLEVALTRGRETNRRMRNFDKLGKS